MWTCVQCGESHEAQFDSCWKCSTAKPEEQESPTPANGAAGLQTKDEATFEIFRGGPFVTWEELCSQAAAFASEVGRHQLITISHSDSDGHGVITVWYWTQS